MTTETKGSSLTARFYGPISKLDLPRRRIYTGAELEGELASSRSRPHIVLAVARGEAVRNFLYSDVLPLLAGEADVTVLSVVQEPQLLAPVRSLARVLPLLEPRSHPWAQRLRALTESAHDRWLWSAVARNNWELRDRRAIEEGRRLQRLAGKVAARLLAHRPGLRLMTALERGLTLRLTETEALRDLFDELRPDLVFNCSHVHGPAAELPLRVAKAMGIATSGFLFSWDNLTSRSRIFVPYDSYLVWHEGMRRDLLRIYPEISPEGVHVTGTPQFDFHRDRRFILSREELCARVGLDPARPFVLYTTGIHTHFPEEHRHVESVARMLPELGISPSPQLLVRTYSKGTSEAMRELARRGLPDVAFRAGLWDPQWHTPLPEDLPIYTSLLHHSALGINAASTVTLELMMLDKPVINLDFDPPGLVLPWCDGYQRHIRFDHFLPIAESGATMVARSTQDMRSMLRRGLSDPGAQREVRRSFLRRTFGDLLDGQASRRVADCLLRLAGLKPSDREAARRDPGGRSLRDQPSVGPPLGAGDTASSA